MENTRDGVMVVDLYFPHTTVCSLPIENNHIRYLKLIS